MGIGKWEKIQVRKVKRVEEERLISDLETIMEMSWGES